MLNWGTSAVDDSRVMNTARIARVAALYRAQTSTEGQPRMPDNVTAERDWHARQWQATLAKSVADLERQRRGQ